jgi:hypothetical protein
MCQDLDMLAHRYDAELQVYSEAGLSAAHAVGTNFAEAALKRACRTLLAVENAREQMDQHVRLHHCLRTLDRDEPR